MKGAVGDSLWGFVVVVVLLLLLLGCFSSVT